MTDKNTLDPSLSDTYVDAEKLQEVIDKWGSRKITSDAHLLYREVKALLPISRLTMAEIEWSDDEHHLAEASVVKENLDGNVSDTVIMLGVNRFGSISALDTSTWGAWALSKETLIPTGRKHRLELEEDEETSRDAEKDHGKAPCLLDSDGDHWVKVDGQWHMVDPDFAYDELPERYGPYRALSQEPLN